MLQLVAHRGDAVDYPENTLPAFESAARQGLRYLECDVQLAADGTAFVVHDASLARVAGVDVDVLRSGAAELDAIAPAEPARFGARFHDVRLPRLRGLGDWLAARPTLHLFVELKRASLARHGRERCVDVTAAALAAVRQRCTVISFDHDVLPLARAAGFQIGWVLPAWEAATLASLEALAPAVAFCDRLKLPASGPLPSGAWDWAVYEVRDAVTARALHARGVRYIETMAVASMQRELSASPAMP
jgi:glycerophosphoryl diester phosphodiesterase